MIRPTRRLLLREFQPEDWAAVLAYQSDPRYLRFSPWDGRSEAAARAFVGQFLAEQAEGPRWKWQLAITLPPSGRLIGNCGLRLDAVDARSGNIGFELDPREWGQGYATEAAAELLRFGFDELGLAWIWSWCVAENVASRRVLERVGLRLEERRARHEWFKGRWWDTLRYGLSAAEWPSTQPL